MLTRPKRIRSHHFGPSARISGFASSGSRSRSAFGLRGFGAFGAAAPAGFGRKVDASGGIGGGRRDGSGAGRCAAGDVLPDLLDLDSSSHSCRNGAMTAHGKGPHDVGPTRPTDASIVSPAEPPVKARRMTIVKDRPGLRRGSAQAGVRPRAST